MYIKTLIVTITCNMRGELFILVLIFTCSDILYINILSNIIKVFLKCHFTWVVNYTSRENKANEVLLLLAPW